MDNHEFEALRNPYLKREWKEGNTIFLQHYGRIDRFEVIDRIPEGYVPWLISRDTFSDGRVIPLCQVHDGCYVNPKTLKAYYCKDKETADKVMRVAHRTNSDQWKSIIK